MASSFVATKEIRGEPTVEREFPRGLSKGASQTRRGMPESRALAAGSLGNPFDEHAQLPTDCLWDVSQCARFFNASESWVYHQAEAGLLPCIRTGRLLRFDPAAVKASQGMAG